jgi:hypothetical protein
VAPALRKIFLTGERRPASDSDEAVAVQHSPES